MPDPKITRTKVTNPDGSVTYKQAWASSSAKSVPERRTEPSKQATLVRQSRPYNSGNGNTLVRQTSSVSKSPTKSSGSREITTIPPMKMAGRTDTNIKASSGPKPITIVPETPQESRIRRYGVPGERVYGKGEKKEKYVTPDYVGKKTSGKAAKVCTTC